MCYFFFRLKKTFINFKLNERNYIFTKYVNKNKCKLISPSFNSNPIGEIKYFPATSKEWNNKVYFFNQGSLKNFPIYNINVKNIITSYFNLFFKNRILFKQYVPRKLKYQSFHKIFVSKPEIKHTNNKVTILIYVFNKEYISLLKRINILYNSLFIFFNKLNFLINRYNNIKDKVISLLYKKLLLIRKHKLNISINKYKFEDIFLHKLAVLIMKFFNKKIEFNIVNLKSVVFRTDIFTELLKQKLRKKRVNVRKMMNFIRHKVRLFKINSIKEKSRLIKSVNLDLLENKHKTTYINYLMRNFNNYKNLNTILKILYNNIIFTKKHFYFKDFYNKNKFFYYEDVKLNFLKNFLRKKFVFNSIKYKNMRGLRLEVRGRLTKRYRADRSIFILRCKGGLKNIDSSFKGLSAVSFRGFRDSNIEYSISRSRRRIGSFGIKG
jgi:hypothetical protein